jgi:hypothetical protein
MRFLSAMLIPFWISFTANAQPVEEFLVRGPDQLHSIAINTFLEERRKNPDVKDMSDNSPVMIRAKQHAIKRFAILDDESLTLTVSPHLPLDFLLFLTSFSSLRNQLDPALILLMLHHQIFLPYHLQKINRDF